MKAIVCTAWGEPGSLVYEDVARPVPGRGEVRIAVRAAGVNFADTLMIAGKYQEKPPFPFSAGLELAGVVAELGPDVTGLKVGDRIMGFTRWGAFAEEAALPASQAFKIPDKMDFATAASFPVAYGTSHMALVQRAHLKAGEYLLVNGASSGVGLTAVEIGAAIGARVIATASSPEKLATAKRYGAEFGIDYGRENIRDRVKEMTDGHGADVIYDPVGGDAFDASLRSIAFSGRYLVIGFASGRIPAAPANYILIKNCDVMGVLWGNVARREPEQAAASYAELLDWYAAGKLKPFVSQTFPLARAAEALDLMKARKITGKLVLTVGEG
jgi:NADPH2:quinone reductase